MLKTISSAVLVAASGLIFCGCISVVRHDTPAKVPPQPQAGVPGTRSPGATHGRPLIPPQQQVGIPGTDSDVATLAEIDAARRLTFDSDKVDILKEVARRPHLSPQAQIRMVHVACKDLTFDSSKVDVLTAIVKGPSFCEPVRHAIVTQLECLTFDSSKTSVLKAVSRRVTPPDQVKQ